MGSPAHSKPNLRKVLRFPTIAIAIIANPSVPGLTELRSEDSVGADTLSACVEGAALYDKSRKSLSRHG